MDLYPGLQTLMKIYTVTVTIRVAPGVGDRWVEEIRGYNAFAVMDEAKDRVLKHCEELYKKYTITDIEVEQNAP